MKIVDLHPEELLDKDARGALSEEERALLDAHLARCETCRFERMVRADFALERSEEVGLSAHRLALLVDVGVRERPSWAEASTAEAVAPVSGRRSVAVPASPVRGKRSFGRVASFVAVVALVVGTVGLAKFGIDRARSSREIALSSNDAPAPSASPLAPTKPLQGMPVADPGYGVARAEPAEAAPLRVDDEAFFTVESFDESQRGDVLDEVWYPRALESDAVPSAPSASHRRPHHAKEPKGPRHQVAPTGPAHGTTPHEPPSRAP